MPVDEQRRGLQLRIEHAKESILADLRRASSLFKETVSDGTSTVGRSVVRASILIAGAVALGVIAAFARRRRRRLIITWK